jgi:hypothetical protein
MNTGDTLRGQINHDTARVITSADDKAVNAMFF